MPLLAALSATAPILPGLQIDAPPQAPMAGESINEPLTELVIPAADGKVLLPGDPGFNDLLPFNLRTTSRPLAIVQCLRANATSISVRWARRHQIPHCTHA